MRSFLIRPVFILVILTLGCKARKSSNQSTVKYGASEDMLKTNSILIKALPGDIILVCGKYAKQVEKSVRDWASQIGRSSIVEVLEQCPDPARNFAFVVETGDNETSKYAADFCKKNAVHAFSKVADYGTSGKWSNIFNCNELSDIKTFEWKATMAHEVGHLWSMCDQYDGADVYKNIGMHVNCSALFRSRLGDLSVMNAWGIDESSPFVAKDIILLPHDVTAIRLMACRDDIAANQVWLQRQPLLVKEWRKDAYFNSEIQRLRANGVTFLTACLGPGTPRIEGAYDDAYGWEMIDCCLCQEQDFDDASLLGGDKPASAPFYTIANIELEPFEKTTCHARIGHKSVSLGSKGRYRYVQSCQKISKYDSQCVAPATDSAKIIMDIHGTRATRYLHSQGNDQYSVDENP